MESFDRLEEKVKKAVDVVKRLRKENADLHHRIEESRKHVADVEKRLHAFERQQGASADLHRQLDGLEKELKSLRSERAEVKERVAKLVEVLDNLE
ncbi:MAG TPA: cell division protein ZapB [Vicinamibacteria bacterium]|nr:cell division protein ZapB [Vicinamibacteria bacterium]